MPDGGIVAPLSPTRRGGPEIAVRRHIVLAFIFVAGLAAGATAVGIPELRGLVGIVPAPTAALPTPGATVTSAPEPTPTLEPPPTFRPSSTYVPALVDRAGIRARLQAALDRGRLDLAAPGVVASVMFADGRQWTGVSGVADLASGRPLDTRTPFALASISKTFLAAEILALVDEHRLRLDEPVAPLLPGVLLGANPIDPRITIRQLLDHTSGLRDFLIDPKLEAAAVADPTVVWTPAMSLAYVGKPLAEPGVGYHYANTNYVLLGLIAESLTGRTLAQEYRARFFDPLGLTTATYQGAEPPTSQMPTAYQYRSAARNARPTDVTDGTDIRPFTAITTAAGAAGSVAAGAADVARWARVLYGGYVLPAADIATMVDDASATALLRPGFPYGLGVQVLTIDGRISYGHSGRLVGARSVMRWFPEEGIAIAVVTNESRFDPTTILRDLFAVVAPESVVGRSRPD